MNNSTSPPYQLQRAQVFSRLGIKYIGANGIKQKRVSHFDPVNFTFVDHDLSVAQNLCDSH